MMKVMWCWRCRRDVPMLDEDEFASVAALYRESTSGIKGYRQEHGSGLKATLDLNDWYEPVRREYEAMTGMADCHENAIMHHRISLYGPPCHACGKPLRTPRAKLCAACWTRVPRPRQTAPE
jgi:hypothetical protein